MKKSDIQTFFEILQADNPHPETELEYVNHFTLLVAVVLSAQATDKGVNKATRALFESATTPEDILALGEDRLKDFIKTIGLYKTKASNVMKLCQKLVNDFNSKVPDNRDALESLPGVGRKTANVVLNVAFNQPTMPVDTHIFRVSNRTGIAPGKTPLEVEKGLEKNIPDSFKNHSHHWMILLGRYVCKARKPECNRCLVREQCQFKEKTGI